MFWNTQRHPMRRARRAAADRRSRDLRASLSDVILTSSKCRERSSVMKVPVARPLPRTSPVRLRASWPEPQASRQSESTFASSRASVTVVFTRRPSRASRFGWRSAPNTAQKGKQVCPPCVQIHGCFGGVPELVGMNRLRRAATAVKGSAAGRLAQQQRHQFRIPATTQLLMAAPKRRSSN